jgi:hypothetical protein
MMSTQQILRFIDADSKERRPPLVGVNFLRGRRVEAGIARASDKAGLIRFITRKFIDSRRDTPRRTTVLRVFTPSGMQAVKVRYR